MALFTSTPLQTGTELPLVFIRMTIHTFLKLGNLHRSTRFMALFTSQKGVLTLQRIFCFAVIKTVLIVIRPAGCIMALTAIIPKSFIMNIIMAIRTGIEFSNIEI